MERKREVSWMKNPWIWAILALSLLCLSLLTAFDPYVQGYQNSDSVVHSLASFDTWTPFFWGQDRLGMPYSLLFSWISDPVKNLVALSVLFVFCTLVMFPLWGYWLTRSRVGFCGGLLASFLYAILPNGRQVFVSSVEHPEYVGALVLGFGGMILLDAIQKPKLSKMVWLELGIGFFLLMLASWVNITMPIFLAGFFVLRWMIYRTRWQYLCVRIGVLMFAFFSILIPTKLWATTEMDTSLKIVGLVDWFHGFKELAVNAVTEFAIFYQVALLAVILLLFFCWTKKGRSFIPSSTLVCWIGGVGFLAALGFLEHVGAPGYGGYRSCYGVPSTLAIFLGACIFLHRLVEHFIPNRWFILGACVLSIWQTIEHRDLPSFQRVLAVFEKKWGEKAEFIIEQKCTHIGGNSWFTFDVLFYTNYKLQKQGSQRRLYPFTFRDSPLREKASAFYKAGNRIACVYGYDWSADPLQLNQRAGGLVVKPIIITHQRGVQIYQFFHAEKKKNNDNPSN